MKKGLTLCLAVALLNGCGEGLVADMGLPITGQERAGYQDMLDRSLLAAAETGYVPKIKLLLADGANVNARDAFGRSPLINAVSYNRSDAVQFLLKAGANSDWADVDGWSALFYAVTNDHYVICQMLINAGADVNVADNQSRRPLFYADERGLKHVANLLKRSGAHR